MSTAPIFFKSKSGTKGVGYNAELLPQVAEVYLRYRDDYAMLVKIYGKSQEEIRYFD